MKVIVIVMLKNVVNSVSVVSIVFVVIGCVVEKCFKIRNVIVKIKNVLSLWLKFSWSYFWMLYVWVMRYLNFIYVVVLKIFLSWKGSIVVIEVFLRKKLMMRYIKRIVVNINLLNCMICIVSYR